MGKKVGPGLLPDYSDICAERALELPPGTLRAWHELAVAGKQMAPEDAALLRVLQAFPWIIEVADRGFDPLFAQQALTLEALKLAARAAAASSGQSVPKTQDPGGTQDAE